MPILEYHHIGATPGRWRATPAEFLQALQWLDSHDFRPITMSAYESGKIDIPAGTHPVVLSFDDGDPGQFQWNAQHVPDPQSAVGILWNFHLSHPEWPFRATFFVNASPFGGDSAAKLAWLVAHGAEIGNHTYTHPDLKHLTAAEVDKQVGEDEAAIAKAVPGYAAVTFALPFGVAPAAKTAEAQLSSGSYDGTSWHFKGVALVGASPAPSPFSRAFDPMAIPRIQTADPSTDPSAERYLLAGWESFFEAHPNRLYTSDGNPNVVTFPKSEAKNLLPSLKAEAKPIP